MKKKLPKFKSAEHEALFWESHDIVDYVDENEFEVIDPRKEKSYHIEPKPKKILFSMRLEKDILQQIKKIAEQKKINYQTMLRKWIINSCNKESKKK